MTTISADTPARRERERLADILEDPSTDQDAVPSFMRGAYAQWLRDMDDTPADTHDVAPSVADLLKAHGRYLPDLDEGEPLGDDTEWTCNECSDTIGIGQDFEDYVADHQARVLAAHGHLAAPALRERSEA